MHAVGDMGDRDLRLRPARKKGLENTAADLAVQSADAVDSTRTPNGQVGHVEGFRRGVRIPASKGQQPVETDAELFGICFQVPARDGRGEAVETGFYRGMGGKDVSGPCRGQCHFKGLSSVLHARSRSFEDRQRRVALVEMADLGLDAEQPQQMPAADAEHNLLLQPHLRTTAVKLGRDALVGGAVGRVVAV